MKISSRAKQLIGQSMFQIKQIAEESERKGKKLIHFEIGDPYFNSPRKVKKACIKAIRQNKTHYVSSYGLYELRKAISEKHRCEIDEVLIAPANFSIFLALSILCNKGDKITIPVPGFPTYLAVAKYLGLKIVKNAEVVIGNYPNNPTGEVKSLSSPNWLILDGVYDDMIYESCIKSYVYENIIRIFSFSKSHSMSGFRLGYMIAPKEIIDKCSLLIETTVSCFPEFIQIAGLEALKIENYKMKKLKEARDLMVKLINETDLSCESPIGGIYCWAKIKKGTSKQYFDYALSKGIVVCPGTVFGKEGYVRFCFARPIKDIKEIKRL